MSLRASVLAVGVLLIGSARLAGQTTPGATPKPPASAFSTIQGTATDGAGVPLPDASVRLRDARVGHILGARVTDKAGQFSFTAIDPGNYVVELIGSANAVIAATPLVSVNGGETASVMVRLPNRPSLLAAMFGERAAAANAAGFTPLIPALVTLIPEAILLSIPALVPIGSPVSER